MKIKTHLFVFFAFMFLLMHLSAAVKAQNIQLLQQGPPTSIRGLSVVDNNIAWLSGSKGYVAHTIDGGKNWIWQQVKGYEQADFRSIEAFSDREAIIMSSGTPALILKTIDGGANWQLKYRNTDTAYFFDAMSFANPNHGLILGDPIKNKFVLLETINGGETWKPFDNPPNALPGEAAFAASGTCLRYDKSSIRIVTGGSYSRFLECYDDSYPHSWVYDNTFIKHGKPSQGAFSVSGSSYITVGGDYKNDHSTDSVAEYYSYTGKEISPENGIFLSKTPPSGYQSCVEYISGSTFLSTGTPGTNITIDGGKNWSKIDTTSFNVCRKARHGTLVLLAGSDGKIGILKP